MELKLITILNAKEPLMRLSGSKLPIKISYKLSKILKKVSVELDLIEEQRTALVRKYGEESGGVISVPDNKMSDFSKEYFGFLSGQSVDIDVDTISIDEIPETTEISVPELMALDFIFESDGVEDESQSDEEATDEEEKPDNQD